MTRRSTPAAGRRRSCGTGDRRDGACGRQRSWDGRDSTSGPNHPSVGRAIRTKRRRGAPIFQPRAGGKGEVRDLAGRVSPAAGRGGRARARRASRHSPVRVGSAAASHGSLSWNTSLHAGPSASRYPAVGPCVLASRGAATWCIFHGNTQFSSCGAARGLLIARRTSLGLRNLTGAMGRSVTGEKFCMGGIGRNRPSSGGLTSTSVAVIRFWLPSVRATRQSRTTSTCHVLGSLLFSHPDHRSEDPVAPRTAVL